MLVRFLLIVVVAFSSIGWSFDGGWDQGQIPATKVFLSADGFDGNLTPSDTTVQDLAQKFDDYVQDQAIAISSDGATYYIAKKIIFDGATITDNGNDVYMVSFGTVTPSYLLLEDGFYLLQEDSSSKIIL